MERLHQARETAAAAARRRQIAEWLERHEAMRAIRPRNDEERQSQREALERLELARRGGMFASGAGGLGHRPPERPAGEYRT
jgi:hypothetical protein